MLLSKCSLFYKNFNQILDQSLIFQKISLCAQVDYMKSGLNKNKVDYMKEDIVNTIRDLDHLEIKMNINLKKDF